MKEKIEQVLKQIIGEDKHAYYNFWENQDPGIATYALITKIKLAKDLLEDIRKDSLTNNSENDIIVLEGQ